VKSKKCYITNDKASHSILNESYNYTVSSHLLEAIPTIDEYSSLEVRISSTESCRMATTLPPSPTAKCHGSCRRRSLKTINKMN
jgi:hypothetical protein